ncbi:helix-turn-helix domain-containing protein (plasmid) [Cereibacter azotoformans]|uniref:HTH cro/C1-type domain-containing protein n=1 Tax=Cereibacter sphaeroides (strain ATCC 17025 / ATH 2.4.3) TaxID=349102 RepID=A4X037_CERS5|nr:MULTISPECIES: helix-turn-helix transcriptional regulator [Cereibacter]AXQ96082.1 XRE family transcriptional regulator [Cereibacter sphaeroides]UIJ32920.1 helix-turn-helix domain-containing protein [Cereibacter azotoformans]
MTSKPEAQILTEVGQRIRVRRAAEGLNLGQLARLTGISGPALSLIETGKRDARLTTLARIAAALRVPLEALLADGTRERETARPPVGEGYDLKDFL